VIIHYLGYTLPIIMQEQQRVYFYFRGSILLKGLISLLEIVVGIFILVSPITFLTSLGNRIESSGLLPNANGSLFITSQITSAVAGVVSAGTVFIGLYLLSRGGIKFLLIIAMLKKVLWAFPLSLVVLGAFMTYQIYELFKTHSLALVLITLFDCVVMFFIWKEWKILQLAVNSSK
jgi:uncharacterized membrane protein